METLIVEYLPHFRKWRVWNRWVEGWYKNFDEFVQDVDDNDLTVQYYFTSYTESTRKRLAKHKLLEESGKPDYDMIINDPATKVYLFHGTNAEMLDDFLVSGTFFTTDLTIAMKYGKTIYALELNNRSFKYFELNKEGYFQSLEHIPLTHCIKLELKIH